LQKKGFILSVLNISRVHNHNTLKEEKRPVPWRPVLIFSLTTIGLILLIYIYYQSQKTRIFSEQKDNLSSIAILKLKQIEIWHDERIGDASIIKANEPLINKIYQFYTKSDTSLKNDLHYWITAMRNQYDYSNVILLDTTVTIKLAFSNTEALENKELSKEIKQIPGDRSIYMTDMKRDTRNDSAYLDLLVPIFHKNKNKSDFFGVIVLRINPSKILFPLINLWPTSSKSSETLLIRREGDSVIYLNELRHKSNTALKLLLPLTNKSLLAAKAIKGEQGLVTGVDYRNIPVVGFVTPIKQFSWFMVNKTDKAELLAPVKRYFILSLLISILILILNTIIFRNWLKDQRNKAFLIKLATESHIHELEEKFYTAFHRSPISVAISLQKNNQFIEVNDVFTKDMEYSREEVLGKTPLELDFWFEESDRAWIINEIAENGNISGKVIRLRSKTGKLIYGLTSISVILVEGEPCNLITVVNITESKKAEQQLLESEKLFRNLFENMLNGFAYCKMLHEDGQPLDFLYLNVNKSFSRLTGLANVEGKKASQAIPGIQRTDNELLERYQRVSASGEPETFEIFVESMQMWFLISVYSPQKGYFVAVFDVISERKKAEASLRESEEKFKYVFDHSVIGKSITLPSGEVNVNKAFCDMMGYTSEELSKIKWQDFTHPDDIELTQSTISTILQGNKEFVRFKKRYIRKDGSVLWADVATALRFDKNGKPLYFMTSVNDITEQVYAEEILRNDEKRLRDIFEALPQLYWTCRSDGPCDYLSRQWVVYTGITESEQLGYGWLQQIHPDDRERTISEWNEKIKSEETFDIEFRIRRYDNVYHWFHTRAVPMRNNDGVIAKWLGSNTDIDTIRKAEAQLINYNKNLEQSVIQRTEQLELANKELEAFSYSVSHDLRAPLRAVHGFTKILREDYDKSLDEEGKRICNIISSSAFQMSELIDDLLAFSRIGRSSLNPSLLDMKSMAVSIEKELLAQGHRSKVKFKNMILENVYGDSNLIKHVWNNLISNAIKYSSKNPFPEITISSTKEDKFVIYSVKDNGVGFDMQYSNKLFGVFQRLHSESEFEGNGVGLAIVQRIVTRHGGKVWAEAEIGKGATFSFSLPVRGSEE
jgi:PAS domain S-box-containing protein